MKKLVPLWRQLHALLTEATPAHRTESYPRLRNFILDVMAEGRRKNTINLVMEVDFDRIHDQLVRLDSNKATRPSLTSYLAHVLAACVDEMPQMHSYRKAGRQLVTFSDVDLSVMVERQVGATTMPVAHIIRAANRRRVQDIHNSMQHAKAAPIGATGPLSALEMAFFSAPRWLRRPVWWWMRRDPHLFKQLVGTVGLTSMGMHATGMTVVQPITPMTLTLSVGSISSRCVFRDDEWVQGQVLHLNFGADHDIIDGAPLMRFAEHFRRAVEGRRETARDCTRTTSTD